MKILAGYLQEEPRVKNRVPPTPADHRVPYKENLVRGPRGVLAGSPRDLSENAAGLVAGSGRVKNGIFWKMGVVIGLLVADTNQNVWFYDKL